MSSTDEGKVTFTETEGSNVAIAGTTTPTHKPGLKIFAFGAENIKRLKVVEIHPKGNVVQIAGENESGKSSVLDSIEWGLCGTSTLPSHPIRKGAATGKIQIHLKGELADEYKITRYFNSAGNKLQIEGKDRSTYKSPQQLLDSLMGKISFDPLTFLRMDAKKQLETLRSLVTLDVDIDAIDVAQKADYDERRQTGRDIDALKARLAAMPEASPDLPADPIDVAALTAKLETAHSHNSAIEQQQRQAHNDQEKARIADGVAARHLRNIATIEEQIAKLQQEIVEYRKMEEKERLYAKNLRLVADEQLSKLPEPIDTSEVAGEISKANITNLQIERRKQRQVVAEELEDAQAEYKELDTRMTLRMDERTAAIARAKMPIEKLSFGEGEVLYNELPFEQASNAEQIRVSVALAMASNPTIRVLRIKDGSLLDKKSMAVIEQLATEHDYQVWIERVEASGPVGVVMVDGEATGEEAS
jgi:chromosome segregation ATPase